MHSMREQPAGWYRDPDRPNGEIAKVVRCSVPAVVKSRRRIEELQKKGRARS